MNQEVELSKLEERLGLRFSDPNLLLRALTHPSYRLEVDRGAESNKRLAFLGDAALRLVATEYLCNHYPEHDSGILSQVLDKVVCKGTLRHVALSLNLEAYFRVGLSDRKKIEVKKVSRLLAETLESILGAIHFDQGLKAVEQFFGRVFGPIVEHVLKNHAYRNAVGYLQQLIYRKSGINIRYEMFFDISLPLESRWQVNCYAGECLLATASAHTEKTAKFLAAEQALLQEFGISLPSIFPRGNSLTS